MKTIIDNVTFTWLSNVYLSPSVTNITIYEHADKYLIIATERNDNIGPSITNAAESLWPSVIEKYELAGLKDKELTFIEHYVYPNLSENYDIVYLNENVATWKHIVSWKAFLKHFSEVVNPSKARNRLEEVE